MKKTIHLWEEVNNNSFRKVNAFGNTVTFYFVRDPDADYKSPVGHIMFSGDDVLLEVMLQEVLFSKLESLNKLQEAFVEVTDLLRSASQIAKREGIEGQVASTNWDAFYNRVAVVLKKHHALYNTVKK